MGSVPWLRKQVSFFSKANFLVLHVNFCQSVSWSWFFGSSFMTWLHFEALSIWAWHSHQDSLQGKTGLLDDISAKFNHEFLILDVRFYVFLSRYFQHLNYLAPAYSWWFVYIWQKWEIYATQLSVDDQIVFHEPSCEVNYYYGRFYFFLSKF